MLVFFKLMMFKSCCLKEKMNNNLAPQKVPLIEKIESENEVDSLNNESIRKIDNRNNFNNL